MAELEIVCSDGNADVRRVALAVLAAADRAVQAEIVRVALAKDPTLMAAANPGITVWEKGTIV